MSSPEFIQSIKAISDHSIGNRSRDAFDLETVAKLAAAISSSQYLYARMDGARRFESALELIDYWVSCATVDGLALEFGVFS